VSWRLSAYVALAVWLLSAVPGALALEPGRVTAPSAAASFRLGSLTLTSVRDGGYVTPNDGQDFGKDVGPGPVAKLLAAAGLPTDRITLSVDALVVRMPGHVVLLDTGSGPAAAGVLMASLKMAGVSPDEITDVLITHAHDDHTGGLLDAKGGSAFPRAVIRLSAREWAWMQSRSWARKIATAIAPQVKTFEPGTEILPGITAIALYGHTPGHTGYEILSQGQKLEDIGDIAHSSVVSLARPDWRGGIDEDPTAGAATRRAELKRLATNHELVFAPHFPFPGVGWIVPAGDGYVWRPDPAVGR
jgi:glyoxylase-like metal-dependent hydrolase (beta-lactamase superfamily II)